MLDQFIIDRQTSGMNISTLRKILVSLRQIFTLAVKRGYCVRNPMDYSEMPTSQGKEFDGVNIQVL
jgi:site-specific recombinase XerC